MVGDGGIHHGHSGDVDDDHLGAVGANGVEQVVRDQPGAERVDDADDRQHRQRHLADRLLLQSDPALALEYRHVDDQADGEEGDFLQRHEALESIARVGREFPHDPDVDMAQQAMEGAKKQVCIEAALGVEQTERQTPLDVAGVLAAGRHGAQVLGLQLCRFGEEGAGAQQIGCLVQPGQIAEEYRRVVGHMPQQQPPDHGDPAEIARLQPSDFLADLDRLVVEPHAIHRCRRFVWCAGLRHTGLSVQGPRCR